jgi:hypothetical protein
MKDDKVFQMVQLESFSILETAGYNCNIHWQLGCCSSLQERKK